MLKARLSMITYRVIRESLNESSVYDFDDIEDAREWVRQEMSFDENMQNPKTNHYSIIEVNDG